MPLALDEQTQGFQHVALVVGDQNTRHLWCGHGVSVGRVKGRVLRGIKPCAARNRPIFRAPSRADVRLWDVASRSRTPRECPARRRWDVSLRPAAAGITLTGRSNTMRITSKGQVTIPM